MVSIFNVCAFKLGLFLYYSCDAVHVISTGCPHLTPSHKVYWSTYQTFWKACELHHKSHKETHQLLNRYLKIRTVHTLRRSAYPSTRVSFSRWFIVFSAVLVHSSVIAKYEKGLKTLLRHFPWTVVMHHWSFWWFIPHFKISLWDITSPNHVSVVAKRSLLFVWQSNFSSISNHLNESVFNLFLSSAHWQYELTLKEKNTEAAWNIQRKRKFLYYATQKQ